MHLARGSSLWRVGPQWRGSSRLRATAYRSVSCVADARNTPRVNRSPPLRTETAMSKRDYGRSAVAAITLAALGLVLRLRADVGGERTAEVIGFGEATLAVATDETLVAVGRNQFALAHDWLHGGVGA